MECASAINTSIQAVFDQWIGALEPVKALDFTKTLHSSIVKYDAAENCLKRLGLLSR